MGFRNVVFFSIKNPLTFGLYTDFGDKFKHHIFKCSAVEEAFQIIHMSERAVLLIDDPSAVGQIVVKLLTIPKSKLEIYFLDWKGQSLSFLPGFDLPVGVLPGHDRQAVYREIRSFLDDEDQFDLNLQKDCFFTILAKGNGAWSSLVSSHDKVLNISDVLEVDWPRHQEKIAANIQNDSYSEKLLPSNYYEIIFPHLKNGEIVRISIVHFLRDELLNHKIKKIKKFLTKIEVK